MAKAGMAKRPYRMDARARRSEETARRIREVALDLFLAGSYEGVTLAEIATAAKVTVPTLIAHFGCKEDLFVAAFEGAAAAVIEARDEAPVGDHAGAVRNLIDSYEAHGKNIVKYLSEEDRFPAVRTMTDLGRQYHREWVERVFEPSLKSLRGSQKEQLIVALVVATDIYAWKLTRLEMGLSPRQVEAVMVRTIDALTGG